MSTEMKWKVGDVVTVRNGVHRARIIAIDLELNNPIVGVLEGNKPSLESWSGAGMYRSDREESVLDLMYPTEDVSPMPKLYALMERLAEYTWPASTCVECGQEMTSGMVRTCLRGGEMGSGFCTWHMPAAVTPCDPAIQTEARALLAERSAK